MLQYDARNLEDIMFSEISQSQMDKYLMIPVIWGTESSQTRKDGKQNGSCQGWRKEGMGSYCLVNTAFPLCKMVRLLEMVAQYVNVLNATELYP